MSTDVISEVVRTPSQDTLLYAAVIENNEKVVKFLLNHGADPNARMRSSKDSIQRLIFEINPDMNEMFARCRSSSLGGFSASLMTMPARTSYTLAFAGGHRSSFAEKFKHQQHDPKSPTPMHFAATTGNRRIMELLVAHDGELDVQMDNDFTPLVIAVMFGHRELARHLMSEGANVNARTKGGKMPIHFAARNNDIEMVRMLLRNGANVNARTDHGVTPLHIAVERKLQDVTELLLKSGSDVNASTKTGVTPLHCAAVKGHSAITEMILNYGADVSVIVKKGEIDVTPLLWVTETERRKITDILYRYLAKTNASGFYWRFFKKFWRKVRGKMSN